MGLSVFLSNKDGDIGELLELRHCCQGHFRGSGGKLVFLSRSLSGKGPQLVLRGESPSSSRGVAGFLSGYEGDFWDPLVGPQGSPVSTRAPRGPSRFLCNRCRPRSSCGVEVGISGFRSRAHIDFRIPLGRQEESHGLVSCGPMQVHSPFDPEKQL